MDELQGDESLGDEGGIGDDENGVAENGGSRSAALARSIPSWDEAIGFIVDSNMSTRSQRRPPQRSGSREGGNSRGRSRGRRKN
jgi:hypothetical protein